VPLDARSHAGILTNSRLQKPTGPSPESPS
jgi:hypothetical protein